MIILWLAICGAIFAFWQLRVLKKTGNKEPPSQTIYFLSRYLRMADSREYERFVGKLKGWLREADLNITSEQYIILNTIGVLVAIGAFLFNITNNPIEAFLQALLFTVGFGNGYLYIRVKSFRDRLKQELGEVQELFLIQLQMSTSLDILFSYAADMVEHPLKESFERIAMAIRARQDYRGEIIALREITSQIEVVTFSFILERYLDSGTGHQSIEALGKSVEQYRVFRREMDRKGNMTKLIIASVLMIGSASLITLIPNILETIRSIQETFQ